MSLRMHRQIGPARKVLPEQTIRVLVGPAPRTRMVQFACRWTGLNFTDGLEQKTLGSNPRMQLGKQSFRLEFAGLFASFAWILHERVYPLWHAVLSNKGSYRGASTPSSSSLWCTGDTKIKATWRQWRCSARFRPITPLRLPDRVHAACRKFRNRSGSAVAQNYPNPRR
jgi:hypothetical protein